MHHLSLNVEESWERAKSCARCGILKELRDFGRNIRKAEGIEIYCRACKCQMERQQPDRLPAPESTPLPCNRCGETKPGAEFALDKKRLRGRAVICKQCFSERRRQLYRRHRDAEVLARTQPKHCIECGEEKAVAEFHRNRAAVDGLQDKCKACCNAYNTRRRAGQKARRENGAVRDSETIRDLCHTTSALATHPWELPPVLAYPVRTSARARFSKVDVCAVEGPC
ncbi:hypothetical protein KFL_002760145 [Klebsormidium nitens]|uniref:Stc1 domain-containing protein n=1 Tax=Klebsormidium nitens TaxID=105231 RepID=A0A1Y1IDQ1_KLENI|nr:hypothetical protein KFL_002760145 [Klebsormidium nitens]|eukprot:GAQ86218.1 hypothetical protein KFL_002760145 [Klebsormidium nitens]